MDNIPPLSPSPPPVPMQPAKTQNWWQRNWKWFVPGGCGTLLLLFLVFVGGIFLLVFTAMKSNDVYRTSVARAESNEQVINALGTPIKEGFFTSGSVSTNGPTGKADLSIPISGPKGKATIYTAATMSDGAWEYSKMTVKIDGTDQTVELVEH